MTSFNKPAPKTNSLLWLGFGKLAREFGQLSDASDYQLHAICRSEKPDYSGFSPILSDVGEPKNYRSILQNDNLNLVITLTPAQRSDEAYRDGYVAPTKALCELFEREGFSPRRIVFVSSTGVYGQSDGSWVDESNDANAEHFSGRRIREAEGLLLATGLPVVCLRFSGIYGADRNRLLQKVVSDARSVDPKSPEIIVEGAWTNRVHQHDCARAISHVLSLEAPQEIYLGTDDLPVINAEVYQHIADCLGLPIIYRTSNDAPKAKRLSNRRLKQSGFSFDYENFKEGYRETLAAFVAANETALSELRQALK